MFERLNEVEQKYDELQEKLADPSVWADQKEYQRLAKAHSDLGNLVRGYREYKRVHQEKLDTEEMLGGALEEEMRELAQSELDDLKERERHLEQELNLMLLPKDPNDEKSVLIEIRAGTGGEEAALFAGELLRMYSRYAERRGWKMELMSANETGIGGFKEAILAIDGRGGYSNLKFESGVHRVQRVPETESGGRIHTSAATVAVMPEAEEVEVEIDPEDLGIDTYRSSSAGGQNVQKNETAVRIVHKPTGIVVTCEDERSQFQNKEKAMRMLRAHLLEKTIREQQEQIRDARRSMVGTGDRSEKIRTYNFPQGRVTDHRIGFTLHRIDTFMDGDIQEMIDHLVGADQAARLRGEEESG
ncbi:MAG TPA: peptide chain release factor 1 [Armatimonadota bacterium]|nr:peptide chain release factor 1 [Armatimonadota bacterium]